MDFSCGVNKRFRFRISGTMQLLIPSGVGAKSTRAGVGIATDAGVGTPLNDDVPKRNTIYIIIMCANNHNIKKYLVWG